MSLTRYDYYKYLLNVYGLKRGTITKSWRDPSVVDLSGLDERPVTWGYPVDFSQDDTDELLTDDNGVPMIDYATLGKQYNPWFVGHIALGRFSKWKRTGNERYLEGFKELSDWFVETGEPTKSGLTWLYHFDWFNNHIKPWRSGLSQAHAVSTLLRAASVFDDNKYAEAARGAVDDMIAPMNEGGAAYFWDDGTVSLEESIKTPPSSVINGHLFSVIASWEAGRYFEDGRYRNIAKKGWNFVLNRADSIDIGYWSRYSLKDNGSIADIASYHYHDVHIAQLEVSAAITGDERFAELAGRFRGYQQSATCRIKALWHKRLAKLL